MMRARLTLTGLVLVVMLGCAGWWLISDHSVPEPEPPNNSPLKGINWVQAGKLSGPAGARYTMDFSPDGKYLATTNNDGMVEIWNIETRKNLAASGKHANSNTIHAFSPDGLTLASGSYDGTIQIWDVRTGKERYTLNTGQKSVMTFSFSRDSKLLASGSVDRTVKFWDIQAGQESPIFKETKPKGRRVTFSPDGKTLAAGDGKDLPGEIQLFDPATGLVRTRLIGHKSDIAALSFSPDGKLLASCSDDKTFKLWNVATGMAHSSSQFKRSAHTIWFSADGKSVAAYGPGELKIFDTVSGNERPSALATMYLGYPAFSPDFTYFAASVDASNVKIWHVGTVQECTLTENVADVTSIEFAPDGKIACATKDGTIRLLVPRETEK
jgi:WD40 repeat protein